MTAYYQHTAKQVITVVSEATAPGTAGTPTLSANALDVQDLTVSRAREWVTPAYSSATLGQTHPSRLVRTLVNISFDVPYRGETNLEDGVITTVAPVHPLLLACGLDAQANAESGAGVGDGYIDYTPRSKGYDGPVWDFSQADGQSAGAKTCTIWHYLDGKLHKINGCAFNLTVRGTAGNELILHFEGQGWYNTDYGTNDYRQWVDVSLTAPTLSTITPTLVGAGAFSLFGTSYDAPEWELDLGNSLVMLGSTKANGGVWQIGIANRVPTFSCKIWDTAPGANDSSEIAWDTKLKAQTTGVVQLRCGNGARDTAGSDGLTWEGYAPKFEIHEFEHEDQDGLVVVSLAGVCRPSSGDDDVRLTSC